METPLVNGFKRKPHVLIVSIAFTGHHGPFIQLLYHLAELYKGLTVTVWGTKDRLNEIANIQKKGELSSLDLRLVEVFGNVLAPYPGDPKFPIRGPMICEPNVKESEGVVRELIEQKDSNTGPTAIIADMFQYWSKDLADELDVPWWTYWSTHPSYSVVAMKSAELIKKGLLLDPDAPNPNRLLTDIPGLTCVRMADPAKEAFQFQKTYVKMTGRARRAEGIVLNSSEELEALGGTLEALRDEMPSVKVIPIGPTLQYPGYGAIYAPAQSKANCLEWLDTQAKSSVLYISFGTLGTVPKENVEDLAAGLEASGVPFLWALKPGSLVLSDILPAGFEERTKGRGIVETGWAPQSRILAHSSIGGFLSHCGWNSTLESIVAGVPLICWPLGADQHMVTRFVADVMKVGINLAYLKPDNRDNFENIRKEEVEKAINLVMHEEEGRQLKKKISELEKSLAKSVAKGGSSYQNLHNLLDQLTTVRH